MKLGVGIAFLVAGMLTVSAVPAKGLMTQQIIPQGTARATAVSFVPGQVKLQVLPRSPYAIVSCFVARVSDYRLVAGQIAVSNCELAFEVKDAGAYMLVIENEDDTAQTLAILMTETKQ